MRREEAADWILDIYNREHYRFSRDINLMKILLDAIWFRRENWPMELFEISENGTKVAYLIGYKRGSEKRSMHVMEMAGSRSAIINSLLQILNELDADDILLRVHPTDSSLIEILDSMGFSCQVTPVQGTVRVIDPSSLLTEIGDLSSKMAGIAPLIIREAILHCTATLCLLILKQGLHQRLQTHFSARAIDA